VLASQGAFADAPEVTVIVSGVGPVREYVNPSDDSRNRKSSTENPAT
jgi:hypothetical protein